MALSNLKRIPSQPGAWLHNEKETGTEKEKKNYKPGTRRGMFLQIIGSLKTVPVVNGKQNVPLNLIKIKFGANKRTQKNHQGSSLTI